MYGAESIGFVDAQHRESELLAIEKRVCEYFVSYYVECYDSFLSAIRLGYSAQHARDHGLRILHLGYTQRLLAEYERSPLTEEQTKNLPGVVLKRLLRESTVNEKGAARTAALKLIANTQGMEQSAASNAANSNAIDGVTNNVMIAPMANNADDWAIIAEQSQDKLRSAVRE